MIWHVLRATNPTDSEHHFLYATGYTEHVRQVLERSVWEVPRCSI